MVCTALSFHPGTIGFEPQNTVPASSSSQRQLTQTVRPQKEMVGCFNLTASLDHLDYDCVVVFMYLDSVRSGNIGMRSKHTFTSGQFAE